MAVLNDYLCKAHGVFEAFEPKCPHGCVGGSVQKVYLQAPGMISNRTRFSDALGKDIAVRHEISDFGNYRKAEDYNHLWTDQSKIQTMLSTQASISQSMPERMVEDATRLIGKIQPPAMRDKEIRIADPENLKIS
jgi:hypothetical protein